MCTTIPMRRVPVTHINTLGVNFRNDENVLFWLTNISLRIPCLDFRMKFLMGKLHNKQRSPKTPGSKYLNVYIGEVAISVTHTYIWCIPCKFYTSYAKTYMVRNMRCASSLWLAVVYCACMSSGFIHIHQVGWCNREIYLKVWYEREDG